MMNNTVNNGSQNASLDQSWYGYDVSGALQISLTVVYSLTFIIALFGNIILININRLRPPMNTVSILISNMAVSDFLTALFAMPLSVCYLYVQHRWFPGIAGTVTCKLFNFVIGTTIAVSIFALLTISVERYMAVVRPLLYPSFIKRPILLSIAIWVSSALFMSVFLYIHDLVPFDEGTLCRIDSWEPLFSNEHSPKIFYSSVAAVLYVVPLLVIAVFSALIIRKLNKTRSALSSDQPAEHMSVTFRKRHHRVMRMLLVVVTLFAVCWLPVHVLHILIYFYGKIYISLPPSVALFLYWVSHLNSALNPCVFILLNDSFRKTFLESFHNLCGRKIQVTDRNQDSSPPFGKNSRNGCVPHKRTRTYSVVQWSKRDQPTPVTGLDIKHEGNIASH